MCSRRSDAACLWHSIRVLSASLSPFANGVNVRCIARKMEGCARLKRPFIDLKPSSVLSLSLYLFLAGECIYLCCALRARRAYI